MNTSNNVIFMSNNNFNLPEIPQKRPFFYPYIFTLPKLHLFFFSYLHINKLLYKGYIYWLLLKSNWII